MRNGSKKPKPEKGERRARLVDGKVYLNRGTKLNYTCLRGGQTDTPVMQETKYGWTFTAHVITMYADGSIDWDYSTDGHWGEVEHRD